MYRNTYVDINLNNLDYNVRKLINRYNDYTFFFGVVKADCYGHNGIETIKTMINAGCNYLAVATLDEALLIREEIKNIPILCLGIIDVKDLDLCIEHNITVTICNLDYMNMIDKDLENLKVHIDVNTGMNRLGVNNKEDFNMICNKLKQRKIFLEGIYTHIYNADNIGNTNKQLDLLEEIISDIDINNIPIIHVGGSEYVEYYERRKYINGCRIGISMYGLVEFNDIDFKSTFSVISKVIQINEVSDGSVGYNGNYKVNGNERIAVIPIGYADGILRCNTGRHVYINDKPYNIIGDICMDMLFVKVDESIKTGDKVYIIKDINHIKEISNYLDTIPYEVICSISKRVPRIYTE